MSKCRICGKEFFKQRYCKPYEDICSYDCFTQNFWAEIVEESKADPHMHPVVDGVCYCICAEDKSISMRGFGGSKFYIVFDDGYKVESTNVWSNGQVDSRFVDKLPNNAKFISKKEWEAQQ